MSHPEVVYISYLHLLFTYSTYTVCVHPSGADKHPVRAPTATLHISSSQSAAICKRSCGHGPNGEAVGCARAPPATQGPNAKSPRPTTKGDADAGMNSYCCMKELRLTRLRGSHSSCRIYALDVRAAAAARITITMKRKLVTTFQVARGLKGAKAGWLAVLGPHMQPHAASEELGGRGQQPQAPWPARLRGVIFTWENELSSLGLAEMSYLPFRTQPPLSWLALPVPGAVVGPRA